MKVAAVFGYGPGLGAALAQKWSQQGFQVAILSRTLEKVKVAEKDIANSKGIACDVSDMGSIETAVKEIETSMGPIDTVLWNAGSGVWDSWDKVRTPQKNTMKSFDGFLLYFVDKSSSVNSLTLEIDFDCRLIWINLN